MIETKVVTEIPWGNTEKWNIDWWYPMVVGYHRRNQKEYMIDGWEIFELDPEGFPGDIKPVIVDGYDFNTMTLSQAIVICEIHNKEKLL